MLEQEELLLVGLEVEVMILEVAHEVEEEAVELVVQEGGAQVEVMVQQALLELMDCQASGAPAASVAPTVLGEQAVQERLEVEEALVLLMELLLCLPCF